MKPSTRRRGPESQRLNQCNHHRHLSTQDPYFRICVRIVVVPWLPRQASKRQVYFVKIWFPHSDTGSCDPDLWFPHNHRYCGIYDRVICISPGNLSSPGSPTLYRSGTLIWTVPSKEACKDWSKTIFVATSSLLLRSNVFFNVFPVLYFAILQGRQ